MSNRASKQLFAALPQRLEPTSERRRQQLLRAAAFLIETEGTDAMRIPRVAELAGCARTLVYRYFPSREDLFVAVIEEFYENLGQRLSPNAAAAGMRSLTDRDAARPLLEAIWDSITEVGAAGLILYASPRLGVELADRFAEVSAQQHALWLEPLRERGLTEIEAGARVAIRGGDARPSSSRAAAAARSRATRRSTSASARSPG
jgi:AcrR family transcriptional regulator